MKNGLRLLLILVVPFLMLLDGCGGGGSNGGATSGSAKQVISGTVSPPNGVKPESFSLTSLGATSAVNSQGSYSTKVYQDGVAAIVATPQGKPFGLMNVIASSSQATAKGTPAKLTAAGTNTTGSSIPLNTMTTAVSMVFLSPQFLTNDAIKATKIISIIENDPKVNILAAVINTVFTTADPMSDPRLQQALNDAIQSVWNTAKSTSKIIVDPDGLQPVKVMNLPNTTSLTLKSSSLTPSTPYSSDQDYVNIIAAQNGATYDLSAESKNFGSVDWFSEVMRLDASQFSSFSDFQDKQLNRRTIYQGERQGYAGRLNAPAKSIFSYADLLTLSTDYISKNLFGEESRAKVSISSTEDGIYLLRSYSGSFGTLVDASEKAFVRSNVPNGTVMDTSALVLNTVTLSLDMASIFVDVNDIGKDIIKVGITAGIDLAKNEASGILTDTNPSFNKFISLFQKVFMAIFKSLISNDSIINVIAKTMESGVKSLVDVTGKISNAGEAADRFSQMLTSATPLETTLIVVGHPFPSTAAYAISGRVTINNVGLAGVTVSLNGITSKSTLTDSNGGYTFTNSANGTYSITAAKAGYSFTPSSINSVVVNGSDVISKNFTASAISASYSMSGTIHSVSNSGPVISGATVSIAGKVVITSSTGAFVISGIPVGTYAFSVSGSGFATYTNPSYFVGSNQTGLNFYLTQAATYSMSGIITDANNPGQIVSGATVSIAGKTSITSDTGTFSITGIPAGTYMFSVSKPGYITYNNPAYYVGANQFNLSFYLYLAPPYGTLAANSSTGAVGLSWGFLTIDSANQRALQECGVGCSVIGIYGKGTCTAVASSNYGRGAAIGYETLSLATSRAISLCSTYGPGCSVVLWACN